MSYQICENHPTTKILRSRRDLSPPGVNEIHTFVMRVLAVEPHRAVSEHFTQMSLIARRNWARRFGLHLV